MLGGLGVTGFVAPGFFLSDENNTAGGGTTTTPKTTTSPAEPEGADPQDVLEALVAGLDSQDADALTDLTCAASKSGVDDAIDDVDSVTDAELVDSEEISDDEVTGSIEVTTDTRTDEFEVTIVQDDGDWCWQDITRVDDEPTAERPTTTPDPTDQGTPTAGGQPVAPEALATMQAFLDHINAGDAAGAKNQLCSDAINTPADVDELVGYQPNLAIDPAMDGISSGTGSVQLYLKGTAKGQELEGYSTNLWVTSNGGPWCVHAFRAVVI